MKIIEFITARFCETSTWVGIAKVAGAYLAFKIVQAQPENAVEILAALAALGGAWNIVKPETPKPEVKP